MSALFFRSAAAGSRCLQAPRRVMISLAHSGKCVCVCVNSRGFQPGLRETGEKAVAQCAGKALKGYYYSHAPQGFFYYKYVVTVSVLWCQALWRPARLPHPLSHLTALHTPTHKVPQSKRWEHRCEGVFLQSTILERCSQADRKIRRLRLGDVRQSPTAFFVSWSPPRHNGRCRGCARQSLLATLLPLPIIYM